MSQRPNLLAGERLPPPPSQARSREKRRRINAAALALFTERGYEGTSIEDIARRARLAVGTVYLHYHSKRQLLLALTDELLADLERLDLSLPAGTRDIRAGLRCQLARALSKDLRHLGAYRAWQEAALRDEDLAERQRAIRAWTVGRVLRVLEGLAQLPGARRDVARPALACVLDILFWSLLAEALQTRAVDLERWVDAATHLLYHAMFRDDSTRM